MKRVRHLFSGVLLLVLVGTVQAQESARVIIDIDRQGQMTVLSEGAAERLDESASRDYVIGELRRNPTLPILLRFDAPASYPSFTRVLRWLQESGAESVGILTDRG